ncbi:MAG: YraN family protein [Ruminococcaceae bacterium]|nr:YraN family protein [Oscillospiraceae bacterium]
MSRRADGNRAEGFVRIYLILHGYRIHDTNFYTGFGEIDIVASKGDTLVFVEVRSKTQKSARLYGTPAESVTPKKQSFIIKSARQYMRESFLPYRKYRFDVVEVIKKPFFPEINHIKDAFYVNENNNH